RGRHHTHPALTPPKRVPDEADTRDPTPLNHTPGEPHEPQTLANHRHLGRRNDLRRDRVRPHLGRRPRSRRVHLPRRRLHRGVSHPGGRTDHRTRRPIRKRRHLTYPRGVVTPQATTPPNHRETHGPHLHPPGSRSTPRPRHPRLPHPHRHPRDCRPHGP